MSFEVYYTYLGTDYQLYPYIGYRNVHGHACVEIRQPAVGERGHAIPVAGRYRITFQDGDIQTYNDGVETCYFTHPAHSAALASCFTALGTVTAVIDCPDDPDNPLIGYVEIYPGTECIDLIPGLAIKINQHLNYYDMFDIIVGDAWLSTEERYISVCSFGDILSGTEGDSVTLKIKNVSGSTLTDVYAYILNKSTVSQTTDALQSVFQYGTDSPVAFTAKTAEDLTFDNITSTTVDILTEGETIDVENVTSSTSMTDGKQLLHDGTTQYRFSTTTRHQGVGFVLEDGMSESDTATILTSPGTDIWEVKTTGDWANSVLLGDMVDDHEDTLYIRANPGAFVGTTMNPFEGVLQITDGTRWASISLITTVEKGGLGGNTTCVDENGTLMFRVGVFDYDTIHSLMDFGVTS